jgi:hypothetical protein
MGVFMTLTDDDAARVLSMVVALLQRQEAREVLDGIDESRRLGVEEGLPEQKGLEIKQVARTRRRPPSNLEMVHIILGLLYQRLIVLPRLTARGASLDSGDEKDYGMHRDDS